MNLEKIKNNNINDVYIFTIRKQKYIIRMSEIDNSFEIKILKYLKKYDFESPKLISKFIFNSKNVMILKYIYGNNPNTFDKSFFKNLALLLKKLHSIPLNEKIKKHKENEESLNKLNQYYSVAIRSKYLSKDLNFINKIFKEIQNINLDALSKCIVHSDIKKENIIINNNKIFLIDFGNVYIGNRLIDIIRVIMWFFIKNKNYDIDNIKVFISNYFNNNIKLEKEEKNNIHLLFKYCIIYNLLKDVYLYEKKILNRDYIENNSLKWIDALKNKENILKIEEVLKNA